MTATGILSAVAQARRLRGGVALVAMCAMLGSCSGPLAYNDFDTSAGVTKKDYEDLVARRGVGQGEGAAPNEPPIPAFQSVVAAPAAPELADTRRVSIAVTETTPVRDILIELARRGGVDLEMDPRISGGVIMTATDRPFVEVIDRIAELAELRYRFERNVLRVEIDDPYLEQYRMDVLNVSREAQSSTSSSSDPSTVAQAIGASGGGGNNQSTSSVTMATQSDFWNTIGQNIQQIMTGIQSRRGEAASSAALGATFVPEAQAAAPPAAPAAPNAAAGGAGPGGAAANALNQAASLQGRQAALDGATQEQQPALQSLQGPGARNATRMLQSQYSLNPEAGIITVFATQRQQRAIERYLRDVRASVTQQVLIEAKVVEVTLNDQYRAGVNWNAVFGPNSDASNPNGFDNLDVLTNFTRTVVPPDFTGPTIAANWLNNDGDLSIGVQLVKKFGTVRTLSSPRLTALNNQVALLKVARNQVFFQLQVQTTEGTATTQGRTTVSSQIKTVPVGIIMSVQPAVDLLTRKISLSLRPSITRITGFVNDPGVAITVAQSQQQNPNAPLVSSPIPIIEVREMDSLISLESGQTVVLGGLMQENSETSREGLPGAMDVPLLGQAVSENIRDKSVTELIVFIRATLANDRGTVADEDIRLYKKFTPDPRPIVF